MNLLSGITTKRLFCIIAPFVYSPFFYNGQNRPLLPQSGMCFGPFLLIPLVLVILLSIFLADVVHHIAYGLQKSDTGPKAAESRAQLIASVSFVLFVIAGCAILLFMFRDLNIP